MSLYKKKSKPALSLSIQLQNDNGIIQYVFQERPEQATARNNLISYLTNYHGICLFLVAVNFYL